MSRKYFASMESLEDLRGVMSGRRDERVDFRGGVVLRETRRMAVVSS